MPSVSIIVVIALVIGALNLGFLLGRLFERWQWYTYQKDKD